MNRILLALTLLGLISCEQNTTIETASAGRPVQLLTVAKTQIHPPVHFVGEVAPARTVDLGFEVDGTLAALPIPEGDIVKAGQLVAQLDPRRFELALKGAMADHTLAEKTRSRIATLREAETVSAAELDEAIARETRARLAVAAAETDLEDTRLNAPFDSRVIARLKENHATVGRLEPIIKLAPLDEIEVVIGVPEQLMAQFNPANISEAKVRFSADPDQLFSARWLDYEAQVNRDTQTFGVRFSLTQTPPWPVLPGMTATVLITLAQHGSTLPHIPMSALQADVDGAFFVWVVNNETSRVLKRPVEVGVPDKNLVGVYGGLAPGERIVVAGGAWLSEGMLVRALARD